MDRTEKARTLLVQFLSFYIHSMRKILSSIRKYSVNPCDTFCGKQELDSTQVVVDKLDGIPEQGNKNDVCNISSRNVRLRSNRGFHHRSPRSPQLPLD
jgi:hypothetical protein